MMAESMFRVLSWVLTLSLTLTPAVVGACAALFCGPGDMQVARHDTHSASQPKAPALTDAHAHHATEHHLPASPPSAHLRGLPDHDCCATVNTPVLGVAVVTSRLDAGMPAGPDAITCAVVFVVPEVGDHSPPPRDRRLVPSPISAPLILRI
jgi:hypothetical protein